MNGGRDWKWSAVKNGWERRGAVWPGLGGDVSWILLTVGSVRGCPGENLSLVLFCNSSHKKADIKKIILNKTG